MKNILKLSFLLFAFVLFSCGGKYESVNAVEMADVAYAEEAKADDKPSAENIHVDRKIIKTGRIEFLTSDAAKTRALISRTVSQFNGWISNESNNRYYDGGEIRYNLTLRVPSKYFDALLDSLSANARKVEYKSISAQDVTEEFIDIEARLAVKKELENRYKEILKKANSVDEILQVEREIGNLRSDIESIEGRYKYLQNQVAFSTLDITYYEKSESSFGFGSKFAEALSDGWHNLLWFFIGVANLWAFIAIAVIVVYFIVIWRRRRKKS